MPLSSSNAVKQLSDGNSQGTILGQSSTDLIGFYGLTSGVARVSCIGSNTLSTVVNVTDGTTVPFGFGDATTASTIVAAINALKTMGLIG